MLEQHLCEVTPCELGNLSSVLYRNLFILSSCQMFGLDFIICNTRVKKLCYLCVCERERFRIFRLAASEICFPAVKVCLQDGYHGTLKQNF